MIVVQKGQKNKGSDKETVAVIQRPLVELQTKEFLSIQETCELVGISRTTLWRTIKNGKLKAGKLGSRTVIRKMDLQTSLTRSIWQQRCFCERRKSAREEKACT